MGVDLLYLYLDKKRRRKKTPRHRAWLFCRYCVRDLRMSRCISNTMAVKPYAQPHPLPRTRVIHSALWYS